jgi:hypothetical protein
MAFFLRTTTEPTLAEIARVPQIVIIDLTGPAVFLGPATTSVLLVGEFLKGPYASREVGDEGEILSLYGTVSPYFSQDAAGVQNGGGVTFNGNGMLQLKGKTFKRLVLKRVDCEAVTTDGGAVKAAVTVTVTVAVADQTASLTNKDLVIPAGTRLADQAIATCTQLVAVSQDVKIPKGSTVSANAVTAAVPVFVVKEPEPIVSIAIAAIDTFIDSFVQSGSAGTSITAVNNATALWPPGTGTTLAARIESRYLAAIDATMPTDSPLIDVAGIWSARRSSVAGTYAIQKRLLLNAQQASENNAQGRVALASPDPAAGTAATDASNAKTAAQGYASAASIQDDRMVLAWPHTQVFSEELGSISVTIAPEGWMASIFSNFAEEVNPGANPNGLLDNIVALEPCFAPDSGNSLVKNDYANLQAGGVCGLIKDRKVGWWFSNGVTSVDPTLRPTRVPIKRRRMADLIQAGLADIAASYLKEPATDDRVDAFHAEMVTFFEVLMSREDPKRQRIVDYAVKDVSTADQRALGIFTWEVDVRLLPSMDSIVYRTQIGETVTIPVQQAA